MGEGRETLEEREARWRGWMLAAQSGDAPAYERLLHDLLPHVRRFVQRRLVDPDSVEDVVQNVFTSVHRARHTYRPERPFGPWLYAIARNAAVDHHRARGRRRAREVPLEGLPEPAAPREARSEEAELAPELAVALAELPESQREAVELIHLHGLSVAEAADRAGVSRSALKVRAHRGYKALRARLERQGS